MKPIKNKIGQLTRAVASQARKAMPSSFSRRNRVAAKIVSQEEIDAAAPYFDSDFYLRTNPDVAEKGVDPLRHYLTQGWMERRDPSRNFSTAFYLDAYPDIVEHNLNPLIHYVISGRHEGRRAKANGAVAVGYARDATVVSKHLKSVLASTIAEGIKHFNEEPNAAHLNIHWVVPDFSRGGGGHMTIFRMVHLLEARGHKCTIWILAPDFHADASDAYDDIVKYFQCIGADVKISVDGQIDAYGDALIATGWNTAYAVAASSNFREKFYFVQDHEPQFYPTGTDSLLAEASYNQDLACICAGVWLKQLMETRYGRWARSFDLAYDHEVYKPSAGIARPSQSEKKKIAVYAREATSRRCVSLALMALELLGTERDDFEVHFFGQERLPFSEVNYEAWNHGVLNGADLAKLYNECNIGICFSATNYSLVPQEMMACGLPVIELNGDSTRSIFPEGVVALAGPQPEDIKNTVSELLSSEQEREHQRLRAASWVTDLTWEKAADAVEAAILERMEIALAPYVTRQTTKVLDVVIPTYNGVSEIERVVEALRAQTMYREMQIYCIDSSSTDGTQEWLSRQSDIFLSTISQAEFQHGRTRNLGASLGQGAYVAFLTQDAIPATQYWANDICQMMRHFPSAAGLFGRHLPYPNHSRVVREEINQHFNNMLKYPLLLSKDTDVQKWNSGDIGWRQLLHYYSDNNSCMRRDIWREIPYPEVDYGEDQIWAKEIIEQGYSKIYAPTATVYHSHDYGPSDTYKRSVIEARFFYEYFGYELAPMAESEVEKIVSHEQKAFGQQALLYDLSDAEVRLRETLISQKHRGWFDGLKIAKAAQYTPR
ncbi:UNVERIFIED_ORG: glycosyltransferase involved in cell wall biosynthesis/GT2 family glycosyltransferase [Ensifer adhaerens]|nr:glycosyltransferase involved in cell wall biosynthesis/GT2 family glycosyltransferase [Ensifer adhaerens]